MTMPIAPTRTTPAHAPQDPDGTGRRLRDLADQLEGLFIGQLFQAMRASVPSGGLIEQDSGQQMFNAMMDERLADVAAHRMTGGISEALYRQLQAKTHD